MLSTLTRDGSRHLTKNRNRSGNVVEDIHSRSGTCEVSRDEHARVSPVTLPKYTKSSTVLGCIIIKKNLIYS